MIHETAIFTGDVTLGAGVIVEPYAVITGPALIHAGAYIGAHACVGAPAQHHGTYPAPITGERREGGVVVGAGACVREYATIHQGIIGETVVGADTLLMAGVHVAHDCLIGERVTLGSFSILGGLTIIGDDVTFGQGAVTHPWVVICEGAMIGLNSSVIRDVDPFTKVVGSPARVIGTNGKKYPAGGLGEEVWAARSVLIALQDARRASWARLES